MCDKVLVINSMFFITKMVFTKSLLRSAAFVRLNLVSLELHDNFQKQALVYFSLLTDNGRPLASKRLLEKLKKSNTVFSQ